ncbi:gamma-glutamylcyclotransferase family protein [Ruania albidiflava]|uniref:gamma-glutamylcyclotransferase family protein n=1 Tax=Ruania albidiflava TaxID=366586 RepID=UPI0023F31CBC|nr:gamma-glutamylcyclotransferase family protein [Ruania albidiflava]
MTRLEGTVRPTRYVFGYGSLLHPESLRRTLSEMDLDACIPARAAGLVRCFDVAFPNDGSQQDKAYYDTDGSRPPRVLLANLRPQTGVSANGVCLPVDADGLDALRARERRYAPRQIAVEPYPGWPAPEGVVLAFLGQAEFTRPDDVSRGLLSSRYRDLVVTGAQHWEGQVRGFGADFHASTHLPPAEQIHTLQRVDLGADRVIRPDDYGR